MAFVSHLSPSSSRLLRRPSAYCAVSKTPRYRPPRLSYTPPPSAPDDYSLDLEPLKEKASSALKDVGSRPLFYTKIAGYGVGALVLFTILRAIIAAVDSIPILPGGLELIGLGYTAWFVWRYVLFKESRQELLDEIEDFLGRAKPGSE